MHRPKQDRLCSKGPIPFLIGLKTVRELVLERSREELEVLLVAETDEMRQCVPGIRVFSEIGLGEATLL